MVEIFPVFDVALCGFVPGQVGNRTDESGGNLRNHNCAPCRIVPLQLKFKCVGGDVLQVQIKGGHHVEAFDRIDEVIVCHRHPLVARHAPRQLLSLNTGKLFVPRALDAHPLVFAVNADGAGSELAKGTPPVLTAFKDKPAFVPAQFHKGEFPQFLIIRKRNVAPDHAPRCPRDRALSNLLLMALGVLFKAAASDVHRVSICSAYIAQFMPSHLESQRKS